MTDTSLIYLATAAAVCYAIYRAYKLGQHHGFSYCMKCLRSNPQLVTAVKDLYSSFQKEKSTTHHT